MGAEQRAAECVVVGAGMSGLAAATALHEAGIDVVVVEARDRVGGRTCSVKLEDGTSVDVGGQWIGARHHRLLRLGERHGARVIRQYDDGDAIISAGEWSTRVGGTVPFGLGPLPLFGFAVAVMRFDSMARRVPTNAPQSARRAAAWDSTTVAAWIDGNVRTARARAVFSATLQGLLAADPADISLLHALSLIHGGQGLEQMTGTVGSAQDAIFADGMQPLAESVAATLGDRVLLSQPVRRIAQDDRSVTVQTDDHLLAADRVIVALPPTLAGDIAYAPALPAAREEINRRVPQGSAIKCLAVYDRPFWRDAGLAGVVLDADGPVSMIVDGTRDPDTHGILVGFLEAGHAREVAGPSTEARRTRVLDCFARHFGPAAGTPREYLDHDWSDEPFTRGCYGAATPPGVWTGYGAAMREPAGRIHWASSETATEWSSYIEGALQSGERAASEVLTAAR